jgi:hypothetical protein
MSFGSGELARAKHLAIEGGYLRPTVFWPDAGFTMNVLKLAGWHLDMKGLLIPEDMFGLVDAYVKAGGGAESVGAKLPLLAWLVYMQGFPSKQLLKAVANHLLYGGSDLGLRELFADEWCQQILLDNLPVLPDRVEMDRMPSVEIIVVQHAALETSPFVGACIRQRVDEGSLTAQRLMNAGNLFELLRVFEFENPDVRAIGRPAVAQKLIGDTLLLLLAEWGWTIANEEDFDAKTGVIRTIDNGGSVNRKFAKQIFRAIGGLERRDD